jgi:hypothetical protein
VFCDLKTFPIKEEKRSKQPQILPQINTSDILKLLAIQLFPIATRNLIRLYFKRTFIYFFSLLIIISDYSRLPSLTWALLLTHFRSAFLSLFHLVHDTWTTSASGRTRPQNPPSLFPPPSSTNLSRSSFVSTLCKPINCHTVSFTPSPSSSLLIKSLSPCCFTSLSGRSLRFSSKQHSAPITTSTDQQQSTTS